MNSGGWANRILRWFWRRERSQPGKLVEQEFWRSVRTVETVQSEERTFLIGTLKAGAFKNCPLCGQTLGPSGDDSAHPHLLE